METNPKTWRVTNINANYTIANSYPSVNRVPATITDEQVKEMADCWTHKRFPVLVWSHPHSKATITRSGGLYVTGATIPPPPSPSSTPTSSAPPSPSVPHHSNSTTSLALLKGEATFIDAISETNPDKTLHIFDTGHQSTAQLPNYQRCRFYFLGLAGVILSFLLFTFCEEKLTREQSSELRDGFDKLLAMHKRHYDKTWSAAISSHWVDSLKVVLNASVSIVNLLELGESILIQHSYDFYYLYSVLN